MKEITLTASEMVDGKKVLLGSRQKFPIPESLEEMIIMTEAPAVLSEEELVSCFNYGWKVKSQAKLRSGADPKAPSTVFKKVTRNVQEEILQLARDKGLIKS